MLLFASMVLLYVIMKVNLSWVKRILYFISKWSKSVEAHISRALHHQIWILVYGHLNCSRHAFIVTLLAQYTKDHFNNHSDDIYRLSRKLQKPLSSPHARKGPAFVHIRLETAEVVVYIDAAFAVNMNKSSQLGVPGMVRNIIGCSANNIYFAFDKASESVSHFSHQNSLLLLMALILHTKSLIPLYKCGVEK